MKNRTRIAAAGLSALLLCSIALPTIAAVPSTKKEEVVYIMTDAEGTVQNLNVVNIFGRGSVTDYGDYTDVKMLTTNDPITQNGDEITFTTDAERVYYQGTLENREIPWDISIRYTLDGKDVSPDELGGKSGKLKIRFTVTKNEKCSGTFYEDYALQAAFALNTDTCQNIIAPDATMANVGANKQLSYVILPGQGIDTTITADVADFAMDAVTINAVKMNLNITIDTDDLKAQVGEITDAVSQVNDGAAALSDGSAQLHSATGTLNDAVGQLNSGAGQIADGAESLSDGLSTLSGKSADLQNGAYQAFSGLCSAAQTMLNSELSAAGIAEVTLTPENYTETLSDLKETLHGMLSENCFSKIFSKAVEAKVTAAIGKINDLQTQLDNYQTFYDGVTAYTNGVDSAASGAAALRDGVDTLHRSTVALKDAVGQLNGKTGELADGARTLHNGTETFAEQTSGIDGMVDDQIQNIMGSLTGGDEIYSFVSEKNTNVDLLQFVIKTAAIEKAEETTVEEPPVVKRSFWQKLLHLFGLN